ncbi:MAG: BrnA antitoxin family protein [Treponema sp.]|nr:BrnA antitoxin family protein [Treponema sp.]
MSIRKRRIKKARLEYAESVKCEPVYDEDCPASTPKALEEFGALARELRRDKRKAMPSVTIRFVPDCLSKYKALGKGYTGIIADVLKYAADNPDILSKMAR